MSVEGKKKEKPNVDSPPAPKEMKIQKINYPLKQWAILLVFLIHLQKIIFSLGKSTQRVKLIDYPKLVNIIAI